MSQKISNMETASASVSIFPRRAISLVLLYWKSDEKLFAWFALSALCMLSLMGVATAVAINEWYKYFYNAIQAIDQQMFYDLLFVFVAIVSFSVVRSVLITYLVGVFSIKWRRWLTEHYLSTWIIKSTGRNEINQCIDNPDQRIADDINKFTFETVDLFCGLVYTIASVTSFGAVLISISGDGSFWSVTIPAYMFWVAVLYAVLGTYISQKLGFKLISLSNTLQRSEADFRYLLVRFRDCSRMSRVSKRRYEKQVISDKLDVCIAVVRSTIRVKMRLSLFTESYSQLTLVFSSVLSVPRFFSGSIMLGDVMQINSAFGNLCNNLSWFINAFPRLADWKATTDRLIAFEGALALLAENYDVIINLDTICEV